MVPQFTAHLMNEAFWLRLRSLCDVIDPEPITAFADLRAVALLPRAEILLTSWGCPPIDATAPR